MEEKSFFQKALADFTYEAACGGAVRHLADRGFTTAQIRERLDFPVPYGRIQKEVWKRLVSTGVILREEPGGGDSREKTVYVREYDRYGKASFRREKTGVQAPAVCWREQNFPDGPEAEPDKLAEFIRRKTEENGVESSYLSWELGITAVRNPGEYRKILDMLEQTEREYVEGLLWENRKVYHRLDSRMREILVRLYGGGCYHGQCFFLKTGEKIFVSRYPDS